MSFKLKCYVFYFLFVVIYKSYVICFNELTNSNSTEENKNYVYFTKGDKNEGCTGTVEQKLINGEKFLKGNNILKKNQINPSFLSIKNHYYREFRIYFFKSSSNIISNDFYKVLFECAEASSAKPYLVDICVNKYFKKYNINFSSVCLSCFTDFIGCSFISCNKECSTDQCNSDCKECSEKNCFKKLLSCTKLDKLPDPCK